MGTHPIFESDFDCLTVKTVIGTRVFNTMTADESTLVEPATIEAVDETSLTPTGDNGPVKLDRVPEHILKKRKKYQGLKRREKEEARLRKTKRTTPTIQFKRAEHFLRAAKLAKRDTVRAHRNIRKLITKTDVAAMMPREKVKLVAVIRLRTADGIGKLAIAAMRKLGVLKLFDCSLVRYDEKSHRLLKACEPYVTWGEPDVQNIRALITKRGFAVKDGVKTILNSNAAVEEAFGSLDMLAIEDLISELVTVGTHFDLVQKWLAPFQLGAPAGGIKKDNFISFSKGGQNGDRAEKINELLRKMT